jgi:hypothetical protein
VAARTLAQQLGGFTYEKRLALKVDEDWVLLFNKGDEVRLAVWTTSKTPHEVTIPMNPGTVKTADLLGGAAGELKADAQGLTIRLSDSVQYLTR